MKVFKIALYYLVTNIAIYIAVFAAFDRMVAVWFPLKMKIWCNLRVAWAQIIIALLVTPPLNFSNIAVRIWAKGGCTNVRT